MDCTRKKPLFSIPKVLEIPIWLQAATATRNGVLRFWVMFGSSGVGIVDVRGVAMALNTSIQTGESRTFSSIILA